MQPTQLSSALAKVNLQRLGRNETISKLIVATSLQHQQTLSPFHPGEENQ